MHTGLSYRDVTLMVKHGTDRDGNERKFFGRNAVLGQWHALKKHYWNDHVGVCAAGVIDATDRVWRVIAHRTRAVTTLDEDDQAHLKVGEGDDLDVYIDGDAYPARLCANGKLVVEAEPDALQFPCSSVRIRTRQHEQTEGLAA